MSLLRTERDLAVTRLVFAGPRCQVLEADLLTGRTPGMREYCICRDVVTDNILVQDDLAAGLAFQERMVALHSERRTAASQKQPARLTPLS
jgi:hypothetical protein